MRDAAGHADAGADDAGMTSSLLPHDPVDCRRQVQRRYSSHGPGSPLNPVPYGMSTIWHEKSDRLPFLW